jgi:hypothetical protein
MTGLEGTRRESYGLDESKAITSEVYVPLAAEPFGRWLTGRNRFVLYCIGGSYANVAFYLFYGLPASASIAVLQTKTKSR